jgi:hypothetical protein
VCRAHAGQGGGIAAYGLRALCSPPAAADIRSAPLAQFAKILSHIGEPVEPPSVPPARGPPTEWSEFIQVHDARDGVQDSHDGFPVIDIHSL